MSHRITVTALLLVVSALGTTSFADFLQLAMSDVAFEANEASGPLLYREVPESQLVSVRAKISSQTAGNWSQAGVIARVPNTGSGENWQTSWSFRPAGTVFQHQSNQSLNGAEMELNDGNLSANDLMYIRLDNMGGGVFQAYRGSGPDDNSITWTPQMDANMMPQPQTNANLVGQNLQVGVAAGAIDPLANANVLFDWVEIQTTSQTFRDDFNYTRDLGANGVQPGGIWTEILNGTAGGFNTRVGATVGRCVTCTWNVNGSGNFNVVGNWTGESPGLAFPPNGSDTTVVLGPVLTNAAGATVYQNSNITLKELRFENANPYALAGPGAITLEADSGNALINVTQGNHEIQVDLVLNDNVTATAAAGSSLNINTPVYLNGHTFTVSPGSTVSLNDGSVLAGSGAGAGQIVNGGNLSGLSFVDGNFVQSGDGNLTVNFGGAPISVAGTADLGGTLDVSLGDGFGPAPGTAYTVLMAESIINRGLSLNTDDARRFQLLVGDTSLSLVASAIPEPGTVALAFVGATGLILARRRRNHVATDERHAPKAIRGMIHGAAFFCALASSNACAQAVVETRRDDFDNYPSNLPSAHGWDFTTGNVPAGRMWSGVHNPMNGGGDVPGTGFFPAFLVADGVGRDGDITGKLQMEDLALHMNASGTPGTGWEPQGDKNTSPFLFTTMDPYYDFDATVKIDSQTAGNWSYAGIIARVAGPPVNICCGGMGQPAFGPEENFVTVGAFRDDSATPAADATLLLQNTVNGASGGGGSPGEVNTDLAPAGAGGGPAPIWIRVLKRGGSITGASSLDGTTWVEPANALVVNPALTRTALGQATLEVGLTYHTYTGGIAGRADFDFFELIVREPSTPTDAEWTPPAAAAGSGNWNAVANWTANVPGTIPNQDTMNVLLGGSITGPSTVFNNSPVVVKSLTFNNANKYAIGGTGSIALTSNTGASEINVQQGSHEIQLDLALANPTTINAAAGSQLDINNTLDFTNATAGSRTLSVAGEGRVNINNNIDLPVTGAAVTVNGGHLGGNGRINGRLTNTGGMVSPGVSVGTLSVEGTFQQNAAGTVNIELGGTAVGQYDRLAVVGGFNGAILDGLVDVTTVNDFVPAVGNTFDILTVPSGGGINNSGVISLHSSDAPFYSLAVVSGTILRLTLVNPLPGPGLPGDYNGDGKVDAADYVVWRKTDGSPGGYTTWRTNFGRTSGSGSSIGDAAAVPEPTSIALVLVAIATSLGVVRRGV